MSAKKVSPPKSKSKPVTELSNQAVWTPTSSKMSAKKVSPPKSKSKSVTDMSNEATWTPTSSKMSAKKASPAKTKSKPVSDMSNQATWTPTSSKMSAKKASPFKNKSKSVTNLSNSMKTLSLQSPTEEENFRTMRTMPLVSDLLSTEDATNSPFLRPNSTWKPYPNVDTYLETHLRLLWADFIQPLRESIGTFCKGNQQVPATDGKPSERIHFYRNVQFIKNSFLSSTTVPDRPDSWRRYNIQFDSMPGFDWEKNKRLIYGSLVCLWNASLRLVILATVTQSDPEDLEKGWLTISIAHPPEDVPDFARFSYTMLECDIFYEPYRVVMEVYQQQLKDGLFPFKEYLLGWKRDPGVPGYLNTKASRQSYRVATTDGRIVNVADALNLSTWPSAADLGVNPIQRTALHAAMTRRLALIQGPPGTGKTFIGRKIISTLLDNKHLWHDEGNYLQDNARLVAKMTPGKMHQFWEKFGSLWRDGRCPIVVICLTNQALDQFLEGVLKCTKKVIRIGSQSQSALLEGHLMSVYKENVYQERKTYKDSAFLYHNYRKNGYAKLIQDTVDDIVCLTKKLAKQKKEEVRDLVAESLTMAKLAQLEQVYKTQIAKFNGIRDQMEEVLCRSVDVIGLTTTGAARRRNVLALLRPKIVLVEEAAQVLEPHIVASLTTSVQHLIMIGDHLQLRPACNVHKLAQKYHMDVSLFERLVKTGVPSVMLAVQHRMRPQVARLIVPSVYSHLENHSSVLLHPSVPSVQRDVFFLDHDHPEQREEGGSSYFNAHEAAMALRLAHFLCEQGLEQEKITVLVTYAAQARAIAAHRKEHYTLRSVDRIHVTTVDNYQGEENDVIILSTVRNNAQRIVGFLKTPNRVCVALSRAKNGLFILGNIRLLAGSGSKLWMHVQQITTKNQELGKEMVLRCDRHPDQTVKVKKPEDFPICGIVCGLKCGSKLDCGHPCQLPCRNNCHHADALCQQSVSTRLPCGHSVPVPCGAAGKEGAILPPCKAGLCAKKLPCGHPCPLKCADLCSSAKCQVVVDSAGMQKCGHSFKGPCHLRNSGLGLGKTDGDCQEKCHMILRCGHRCSGRCGQCGSSGVHPACQEPCQRHLVCGHSCPSVCGQVCPPCLKPCQMRCLHRSCVRLCGQPCSVCPEKCQWRCPHLKCDHPCSQMCQRDPCQLPCPQRLQCGHLCPALCGEFCPPASLCPSCADPSTETETETSVRFVYLRDCLHLVPLVEMDRQLENPTESSTKALECPQCRRKVRLCHGRYADQVRAFYKDSAKARSVHDQQVALLHQEIAKLIVENAPGQAGLSVADEVEPLLKGKSLEEKWRIYEQMRHLCLFARFKHDLERGYSFTTINKKPAEVKLTSKSSVAAMLARHQAVQTALLSSSREFLSPECLQDALAQWRRLDLLRQCLTMQSVRPQSLTTKTCHQLLKNAHVLLDNVRDWTGKRQSEANAILKSAAALMEFDIVRPEDDSVFFQRVTMSVDDWVRCVDCQSLRPPARPCSSPECLLQHLARL